MNASKELNSTLLRILGELDSVETRNRLERCIRLLTEDQAGTLKRLADLLSSERALGAFSVDFLARVYKELGAESLMEKMCFLFTGDQSSGISPMEAIVATGDTDWVLRRAGEIARGLPDVEPSSGLSFIPAVGIDGCKAGWVCVAINEAAAWEVRVLPDIDSVWDAFSHYPLLLIDVPIGLIEKGPDGRPCDAAARKVLGARASTVFSPPARPALRASTREEASEINYQLTGKRISAQAWGIVPKIREVDEFVRANPDALGKLREVHPEVLFWGLNRGTAMAYRKKTKEGSEERLAVLERFFPKARRVCEHCLGAYPRSQLARDDVLDALVSALIGAIGGEKLRTLPATPTLDPRGVPMEMVYLRM